MTPNLSDIVWRKSSRSASNGDCVEVGAHVSQYIAIRDSKDSEGNDFPALMVDRSEWLSVLTELRKGGPTV